MKLPRELVAKAVEHRRRELVARREAENALEQGDLPRFAERRELSSLERRVADELADEARSG